MDEMMAFLAKVSPKADPHKNARKKRQKQAINAGDGRSLRATGRDQQLNVRVSLRIKQLLKQHVREGGLSLWIEEAILVTLRAQGVNVDDA
jgi:hypothetical protein